MHSREQYLAALREEYLRAGKKYKTRLLHGARKRTKLSRKVLIGKLTRIPGAPTKANWVVRIGLTWCELGVGDPYSLLIAAITSFISLGSFRRSSFPHGPIPAHGLDLALPAFGTHVPHSLFRSRAGGLPRRFLGSVPLASPNAASALSIAALCCSSRSMTF